MNINRQLEHVKNMNEDNDTGNKLEKLAGEKLKKLHVAERNSWHILSAISFIIKMHETNVKKAKAALKEATPEERTNPIYESMENSVDFLEESISAYKKALEELKQAGFC